MTREIRNRIFEQNKSLVQSAIDNNSLLLGNICYEQEDLEQELAAGLLTAIDTYYAEKPVTSLNTYAANHLQKTVESFISASNPYGFSEYYPDFLHIKQTPFCILENQMKGLVA